jgi:hypothetical protein
MAGLTTAVLPAARRQAMQWISTLQPSSVWTKDSSTSAALTHTRTANAIHAHVRCLLDRPMLPTSVAHGLGDVQVGRATSCVAVMTFFDRAGRTRW